MEPTSENNPPAVPSLRPLADAAETVLAHTLGRSVQLGEPERLTDPGRRNLVVRLPVLDPGSSLPSSLILKQTDTENYRPDDPESWSASRLFNDWAGAQFLSTVPGGRQFTPFFYGGSRDHGFVLLEDVGSGNSLVEPLTGENPAEAEAALDAYAVCLGRMHASTAGRADEYHRLRESLGPVPQRAAAGQAHEMRAAPLRLAEALEGLGILLPETAAAEIEAVAAALENPGPFLVFTHGDPCPDNGLFADDSFRLFDFEIGGCRHALTDGVYGRILFPTCWCVNRLPDAIWRRMESIYRTELMRGCPEAGEDEFYHPAVLNACAFWLITTLSWHLKQALEEDGRWGISTIRQRIVTRLALFDSTARELDGFPIFRDVAGRLHDRLLSTWGADDTELPLYPAFRGGVSP